MEAESMEYRRLGNSGLKVSAMSYGIMNTGWGEIEDNESWAFDMLKKSIDGGVTYIDTAERYGDGKAEVILGRNWKQGGWDRDDLVISAKLIPSGLFSGIQGLSRKRIRQGLRNSLDRMQLDYADILFLHRYDHEIPLLEMLRAVNWLVDEDYAFYWGTSEFTPQQLVDTHKLCEEYGLNIPIVEQLEYNLLYRKHMEVDYAPIFDTYGTGTTIWFSLCGGLLTGKFNDGTLPPDTRYTKTETSWLKDMFYEERLGYRGQQGIDALQALGSLSKELGCSQAQLALAWVIKNKDVSTAMYGASSTAQVEDNIGAIEVSKKLTPEILERIEGFMQTRPDPSFNWRAFQPFPPRR